MSKIYESYFVGNSISLTRKFQIHFQIANHYCHCNKPGVFWNGKKEWQVPKISINWSWSKFVSLVITQGLAYLEIHLCNYLCHLLFKDKPYMAIFAYLNVVFVFGTKLRYVYLTCFIKTKQGQYVSFKIQSIKETIF